MARFARDVTLAAHTTLGVGGPAWGFGEARDVEALRALLAEADAAARPVLILGEGSNLLVSDAGFAGLVIVPRDDALTFAEEGDAVRVRAAAGVRWDALVARTVEAGLAGLECLSGIPGLSGAAPIQNIGAYGQEVAEVLDVVEVLDRESGRAEHLPAAACGFGYRESAFKSRWRERYVVTALQLRLSRTAPPRLAYAELARALPTLPADRGAALAAVRQAVLSIRRAKAMVLDPDDPDTRSAGSFFTNPLVSREDVERIADRLARSGLDPASMPRYPVAGDGARVKLSAAWLIERSGFAKGARLGAAGLSSRHVLALVNRGGARAAELVTLAARIRRRVCDTFGVTLEPEPVFVGFPAGFSLDDAEPSVGA
jgi:UDP-N-acetylmuramate dehydrogenase